MATMIRGILSAIEAIWSNRITTTMANTAIINSSRPTLKILSTEDCEDHDNGPDHGDGDSGEKIFISDYCCSETFPRHFSPSFPYVFFLIINSPIHFKCGM